MVAAFFKDMACYEMPHKLQIDFQFICSSIYQNSIPLGIIFDFALPTPYITFNNINAKRNKKNFGYIALDMFHNLKEKKLFSENVLPSCSCLKFFLCHNHLILYVNLMTIEKVISWLSTIPL